VTKSSLPQSISLRAMAINHIVVKGDIGLHPHVRCRTLAHQPISGSSRRRVPPAGDEAVDQHRAGKAPFLPENSRLRYSSLMMRLRSACDSRTLSNGAMR
jgi:hypothetical protein